MIAVMFFKRALAATTIIGCAVAAPFTSNNHHSCPPVQGTFFLEQQNLYPESADWDSVNCKLYVPSLYNNSLVIYDPYTRSSEVVEWPKYTHHGAFNYTELHFSGTDYDARSGSMFIMANSAAAFDSTATGDYSHANFTGPNHILRYDTRNRRRAGQVDLTPVQDAFFQRTGHRINGFQDLAEDTRGNSYAIGTFGSVIVKVDWKTGDARLWYEPEKYDKHLGFGGIFSIGDKLVVSDALSQGFVTFDASAEVAKPTSVKPTNMPDYGAPLAVDGLYAPSRYGGKVALWSMDANGTAVFASEDGWMSATFLGAIANDKPGAEGSWATGSVEMADSIFTVVEFFQTGLPAKPKSRFPFFDITGEVDAMVSRAGICI